MLGFRPFCTVSEYDYVVIFFYFFLNHPMSATHYKRPHVDIFICIEMARERNRGTKKTHPVLGKETYRLVRLTCSPSTRTRPLKIQSGYGSLLGHILIQYKIGNGSVVINSDMSRHWFWICKKKKKQW